MRLSIHRLWAVALLALGVWGGRLHAAPATGSAPAKPAASRSDAQGRQAALDAVNAVNAIRHRLGLPALIMDSRLCEAASGHSHYLAANGVLSHTEDARNACYVANDPSERAARFGFVGECYENVREGSGSLSYAVRDLFDAPYHRAPLMQPGVFSMGVGEQGDIVTLLYQKSAGTGLVVYPADGQTGVPVSWDGEESPNPLRIHPEAGRGPFGYAITAFSFAPDGGALHDVHAALTTADGVSVPVYLNADDNDAMLLGGAILVPVHPLRPATVYRVALHARDDAGHSIDRSWSFTTAAH